MHSITTVKHHLTTHKANNYLYSSHACHWLGVAKPCSLLSAQQGLRLVYNMTLASKHRHYYADAHYYADTMLEFQRRLNTRHAFRITEFHQKESLSQLKCVDFSNYLMHRQHYLRRSLLFSENEVFKKSESQCDHLLLSHSTLLLALLCHLPLRTRNKCDCSRLRLLNYPEQVT